MMYKIFRKFFFLLDAERSHKLGLSALRWSSKLGLFRNNVNTPSKKVMGIIFPNTVGLAAGLDKNGDYIRCLSNLGFGFIEIGTVTPKPQEGNPKPRLFRLPEKQAIINRMGFNNKGVDHLVEQVIQARFNGVLGINIGKNAATPIENALDDYLICLRKVYVHASYVAINISSPNTKNLRQLQQGSEIKPLLSGLKAEQALLAKKHGKYVPLVVKIAPDLTQEDVGVIAQIICELNMDGVIATNTTLSRDAVSNTPFGDEAGGLSGAPLTQQSTKIIAELHALLGDDIPIIAAGGIMTAEDAQDKLNAGASLVQLYTGFIYEGPALIKQIKMHVKN